MKKPNGGFKTDATGKLIIEVPKRGGKDSIDDSDSEDDDENVRKEESDDSEDEVTENAKAKSRKRKASSALSRASEKTGASSKYVAGGTGIHRNLNAAASTRSAFSMATTNKTSNSKAASTKYGSEYRSKKAKGDTKKKGAYDPYAYIPLSRNTLNKRKRAKNSGQFKSIVQGARKGANAGSKNKRRKV